MPFCLSSEGIFLNDRIILEALIWAFHEKAGTPALMPGVSRLQPMGHMQSASCFLSKALPENSPLHFLWIVYDCFQATTTKLNSCETGLHGLEYSLDSPL